MPAHTDRRQILHRAATSDHRNERVAAFACTLIRIVALLSIGLFLVAVLAQR